MGLQPNQLGQRIILSSTQTSPHILNQQGSNGSAGIRSAVIGQQTTQTGQNIQIMRTPQNGEYTVRGGTVIHGVLSSHNKFS